MSEFVSVEDHGRVRHLILDRPEKRNAINRELVLALREAAREAADDHGRPLRGRCAARARPSAPASTSSSSAAWRAPSTLRPFRRDCIEMVNLLEEMTKPVIAQIHGACLGLGAEIALACDLRVMADDATFGLPETQARPDPGRRRLEPAAGGRRARHREGADHDRPHDRRGRVPPDRRRQPRRAGGGARARRRRRWWTSCWRPRRSPSGFAKRVARRRREADARREPRAGGLDPADAGRDRRLPRGGRGVHGEARAALHRQAARPAAPTSPERAERPERRTRPALQQRDARSAGTPRRGTCRSSSWRPAARRAGSPRRARRSGAGPRRARGRATRARRRRTIASRPRPGRRAAPPPTPISVHGDSSEPRSAWNEIASTMSREAARCRRARHTAPRPRRRSPRRPRTTARQPPPRRAATHTGSSASGASLTHPATVRASGGPAGRAQQRHRAARRSAAATTSFEPLEAAIITGGNARQARARPAACRPSRAPRDSATPPASANAGRDPERAVEVVERRRAPARRAPPGRTAT